MWTGFQEREDLFEEKETGFHPMGGATGTGFHLVVWETWFPQERLLREDPHPETRTFVQCFNISFVSFTS